MARLMSCLFAETTVVEQSFATDGHLIVNYRSVISLLDILSPRILTAYRIVQLQHGVDRIFAPCLRSFASHSR